MATMTPAQFSDKVQILVRTGKLGQVLAAVGADAATKMDEGAKMRTTGGNPLNVRDGKLRQSIRFGTTVKGNTVTAMVQAGGRRAFYASVHEYGKTITAKTPGGYLRFKGSRGWATVRSVTIPKRPFLAPAREDAIKGLDATLIKRVRQALRTVGIGT